MVGIQIARFQDLNIISERTHPSRRRPVKLQTVWGRLRIEAFQSWRFYHTGVARLKTRSVVDNRLFLRFMLQGENGVSPLFVFRDRHTTIKLRGNCLR